MNSCVQQEHVDVCTRLECKNDDVLLGSSGMQELERLLASSVPECTPPSQNVLGSPPKRELAANPLSHCSSWTRMAGVSSRSNLDMLDTAQRDGVEEVCETEKESRERMESVGVGRSIAIPVPQISRCSSGARWVQTGSVSPGW